VGSGGDNNAATGPRLVHLLSERHRLLEYVRVHTRCVGGTRGVGGGGGVTGYVIADDFDVVVVGGTRAPGHAARARAARDDAAPRAGRAERYRTPCPPARCRRRRRPGSGKL